MRALAVTIACSGCVISAPEGASQLWPPALGLTVEAVVAGDLDANGSTEVVVFGSGTASQAGMYYLAGGTDLVYGSGNPVRSFSRFVPATFTRPLAATYVPGAAPRIYVAHSEDELSVTSLSNTLDEVDSGASNLAGGGALLWTRLVTFPGNMPHVAVSNGSSIEHMRIDLDDPRPIPAPGAPTWNLAQLVTSYAVGMAQVIVVATPDQIQRADLPTTPGSPFAWETVRGGTPPAPAWLGQTAFDLDSDGREEIVGFDLAAHDVCVIDPGAPLGTAPSCVHLPSAFSGNDVTLVIGQNLSMSPGLDILVAQADAGETRYSLIEDYVYAAGALTHGMLREIPFAGPPRGRTVIVNGGPATPAVVLTFGSDGSAVCALGPC